MTVDRDDRPDDDLLFHLASLRPRDVSHGRSQRLRRRCHAMLQPESAPQSVAPRTFRRLIVPALGGAWCLAYLVEIMRCTEAVLRRFGAE